MKSRFLQHLSKSRPIQAGLGFLLALVVTWLAVAGMGLSPVLAQSGGTGALRGAVTDPSGATVIDAAIKVTNQATGQTIAVRTGSNGSFLVPYLLPGSYRVEVSKSGFKVSTYSDIPVHVTEIAELNIRLEMGGEHVTMTVTGETNPMETESQTLGHVTDERMVETLPLVTRNYTQILGLSVGVAGNVNNATALGNGTSSQVGANGVGIAAAGGAVSDNNFQMDGVPVNDIMASGSLSGGIPVPNPDALQEFKVQTSQYDASYGRNAGANVNVVTKSGTNQFHGEAFEFLRNTDLNANGFFQNLAGQPRGVLNENQFGGTLGGPIIKDKLMFFGSYQGTRQKNGIDPNCSTNLFTPPLTNDRSAPTLESLFGVPSINSVVLNLLQAKLLNGTYLIPTPQTVNPSAPFGQQGVSSISIPCTFDENQFLGSMDFYHTQKSRLSGRFFWANDDTSQSLPQFDTGTPSVPGSPTKIATHFRVASLTHTYVFGPNLVNEATIGYMRNRSAAAPQEPLITLPGSSTPLQFNYANIGVTAPNGSTNDFPAIILPGAFGIGGNGNATNFAQNSYSLDDSVTYVRGKHSLRFGGGIQRTQINQPGFGFAGVLEFVPDPTYGAFTQGGVLASEDLQGLFGREWRAWNGDLFVQDSFRVASRFSLNLGFRYERQGTITDNLGRASALNLAAINRTPPVGGTSAGFVVAANYNGPALPTGVVRGPTDAAINGNGQNGWEPRVGFSWQLPGTNRLVLRGGYGIFYTRTNANLLFQLMFGAPYGGAALSFFPPIADPFSATLTFPSFPSYSPSTSLTQVSISPSFRAPISQQYSLNLQTLLTQNLTLEVGYQGARGTKLMEIVDFNQALPAPFGGTTSNTLANIAQRTPFPGFSNSATGFIESNAASWYNALNATLTKRFSKGLELLASYTWASALGVGTNGSTDSSGAFAVGDQNNPKGRYGFNNFVRPQRLVVSYVYQLPSPSGWGHVATGVLAHWAVSGVTTFQSGQKIPVTDANFTNAFGVTQTEAGDGDFAQVVPGCQLVTPGSVNGKLGVSGANHYFNAACFTVPPVIGGSGMTAATAFGNSRPGAVKGPDERDFDIALTKQIPLRESWKLEFRSEFFNAFNTTNFANPGTSLGDILPTSGGPALSLNPGFGVIQNVSVNPRIIQFALKLRF